MARNGPVGNRMITVNFSRADNTARHVMPTDHADYVAHGADPYFAVCRNMLDAGEPDDDAVFVDERGMACLTVRSIHSCARRYRPSEAEKIGAREYRSWFPSA